ncbi:MAG: TIGR04086 family membrane protein [Clostridia bacterium]|nr:TIGR04086 family membrane protein [Clostridia bacterium]
MNTQSTTRTVLQQWVRPLLVGLCVGVLCCTLLLLLAALAIRSVEIPRAAVTPLATVAAGIGAFAGGLAAALAAGRRGLVMGALCGILLFVIILLAGLARATGIDPGYAAIKLAVLTVAGAIGGVLGVNRKRR